MNQALQDVIEHRRTTNLFEPNHTISDEQIEHLVHLATRAPTSFNLQNWRFLAVRTPERKAKLRKLAVGFRAFAISQTRNSQPMSSYEQNY